MGEYQSDPEIIILSSAEPEPWPTLGDMVIMSIGTVLLAIIALAIATLLYRRYYFDSAKSLAALSSFSVPSILLLLNWKPFTGYGGVSALERLIDLMSGNFGAVLLAGSIAGFVVVWQATKRNFLKIDLTIFE